MKERGKEDKRGREEGNWGERQGNPLRKIGDLSIS